MNTPVVLLIFNRPDTTQQVLEALRPVQPSRLLVVADGPRPDRPDDRDRCQAARAVLEQVDWKCEILTHYSEQNLGCRQRVSSGLDWAFQTVEAAIVLEDDCIPHPSFFPFCEELLAKHRDDQRIMAISGANYQQGWRRNDDSYYFSRYNHCWGWASWRRAWQHYDNEMTLWARVRDGGWLEDILGDRRAAQSWTKIFQSVYDLQINSWAFRWTFACWMQGGLSITPAVNLVSNVGFGTEATHTQQRNRFANLPAEAMPFPLHHPPFVIRDQQADRRTQARLYDLSLIPVLKGKVKKMLYSLRRSP